MIGQFAFINLFKIGSLQKQLSEISESR